MRYINRKLVGKGGIAEVYRADDSILCRPIALKLIHPAEAAFFESFLENEARLVANLSHPGIVTVHDMGKDENGQLFLAMEYIDGGNAENAKGLTTRRAAEIVRDASIAVHYAHEQGIIHRDIKPDNILLTKEGVVKVADFGLANSRHSGTPGFMCEGQMRGDKPHPTDDVYSLGATLKALLKDMKPDPRLNAIVKKAMADDRNLRFPTAKALAAALTAFLLRRRRKITLSLASAVLIGVLGALGASYDANRRVETARQAAIWFDQGDRCLRVTNDDLGAIAAFTKALEIRLDAKTYLFRGFAHWRNCDYKAAIADCDKALELEPSNEAARENREMAKSALDKQGRESTSH